MTELYAATPGLTPEEFSRDFGRMWGATDNTLPILTPERRRATTRMMAERDPAAVAMPLTILRDAPFPKLILSGGWSEAFEVVCDTLARAIGGERAVVPGAGHGVRDPAITADLAALLARTARTI